MRRLILGGARSGKSRFAESLLPATAEYVATAYPADHDPEWLARVEAHRARRPETWATTETLDVVAVLRRPGPPLLVDCLTLWLTRQLDAAGAWESVDPHAVDGALDDLVAALQDTARDVTLVSNEVGQGIVPATASARLFRDLMGVTNLRAAAACDEVWFLTAGVPQRLKG